MGKIKIIDRPHLWDCKQKEKDKSHWAQELLSQNCKYTIWDKKICRFAQELVYRKWFHAISVVPIFYISRFLNPLLTHSVCNHSKTQCEQRILCHWPKFVDMCLVGSEVCFKKGSYWLLHFKVVIWHLNKSARSELGCRNCSAWPRLVNDSILVSWLIYSHLKRCFGLFTVVIWIGKAPIDLCVWLLGL